MATWVIWLVVGWGIVGNRDVVAFCNSPGAAISRKHQTGRSATWQNAQLCRGCCPQGGRQRCPRAGIPRQGVGTALLSRAVSADPGGDDVIGPLSVRRALRNFKRHMGEVYRESKQKKKKASNGSEWRYLGRLVLSQRGILITSMIMLVLAAIFETAGPHYSSRALNAAAFARDPVLFAQYIRGMIGCSVAAALFTGLRGACFRLAGAQVVARVRTDLFSTLLQQDIAFFDENETGALTSRLTADTSKITDLVSFRVNIIVRQGIQALGGTLYLLAVCRPLAYVTLVALASIAVLTSLYGKFSRRLSSRVQSALAESNSVADQCLSLVRVVRVHATEKHEARRYGRRVRESLELQEAQGLAYGLARLLLDCADAALMVGVTALGARMVFQGVITGEQLTSFIYYVHFVSNASFDVGDQWARVQEALGGGQAVFDLLDRKPKGIQRERRRQDNIGGSEEEAASGGSPEAAPLLQPPPAGEERQQGAGARGRAGQLKFENVYFSYPTRPGVLVLKGLDLEVPRGQKVALVGVSGGGKSTIIKLLCRFYDPDQGRILLDGEDLSSFTSQELSSRIAICSQEPQLFPISIRENIAYGLPEGSYTMDDVVRAAIDANVHNFVCALPDKYDTLVGEGGASLSGGQKQRVAIARALMRDPDVLLLDEPTSALDNESEKVVQEALDKAGKGRTVILVAHRLSTIQTADCILVMKGGRVVEQGTHSRLMLAGGIYAKLYRQTADVLASS